MQNKNSHTNIRQMLTTFKSVANNQDGQLRITNLQGADPNTSESKMAVSIR